jgi:tryptophan-rich sensory protein
MKLRSFSYRDRIALVTVPGILAAGFLIGQVSDSGYGNPWFDTLAKPAAMPPGWVFGLVWSILYAVLGIVLATLFASAPSRARSLALALFLAQLGLNFSWSPLFFTGHRIGPAFIVLAAMMSLSLAATGVIAGISRSAARLMLPYLCWLSFAGYLNLEIWRMNPAG